MEKEFEVFCECGSDRYYIYEDTDTAPGVTLETVFCKDCRGIKEETKIKH